MNEDAELLRRYAEEGSQEAFTELVHRRLGLVYSAALRQVGGDAHRAEEIAQAVFTDLARKAASLCRHRALVGWFFTSTRYTAATLARSERRRQAREQESFLMNENVASPDEDIPAERLLPLLDDALHQLSEADRRALLLRFFDHCSMAELGRDLGLSEPAAQKRVERALAKLKTLLSKRGLASTAATIGAALAQEAAAATAPTGLAASIAGSALVGASSAGPALGLLSLVTGQKLATGLLALVLAAAVGTATYEIRLIRATPAKPAANIAGKTSGPAIGHVIEVIDPPTMDPPDAKETNPNAETTVGPAERKLDDHPQLAAVDPSVPTISPTGLGSTSLGPNLPLLPPRTGNDRERVPIFDPVQLDQQPVPAFQARPNYPAAMSRSGISGRVVVDFIVDESGIVHHAFAASSSRHEFEAAAIQAVSEWKFTPGRKEGRAVSTHLQAPIVFTFNPHD